MASLKIYLNSLVSQNKGIYPLVIELHHLGMKKILNTPYFLSERNFDSFLERAIMCKNSKLSEGKIYEINRYISHEVGLLQRIIDHFDTSRNDYTITDILDIYHHEVDNLIFTNYVDRLIICNIGRESDLRKYRSLQQQIALFKGCKQPFCFDDINKNWLVNFRIHLSSLGYGESAIRSYFRILHRICIDARKDGVKMVTPDPFLNKYSESASANKQMLDDEAIKKMKEADLSANPDLSFSRDIFLFSYMTDGLSFKDIANLKNSDLHDGMIRRSLRQSRKAVSSIWITPELQELIDKYKNDGEYVFPIFENSDLDIYDQYRMHMRRHNSRLKELSSLLGISCSLSSHKVLKSTNKIPVNKNVKISLSLGDKGKTVNLSCHLSDDIKQSVLAALDQLMLGTGLAI